LLLVILLILGLAPAMCVYQTAKPWNPTPSLRFTPVRLPPKPELARHLGAFELDGAWQMTSVYSSFGGYSALVPLPDGRLIAIADNGRRFTFSPPGVRPAPAVSGEVLPWRVRPPLYRRDDRDTESATRDPVTGMIWVGREGSNSIARVDPAFRGYISTRPAAMRDWPENGGPEAMVRLADGRFIVLEEVTTSLVESRLHHALLFPRDPLSGAKPVLFTFAGAPEFSTTDMAQLPDGRVLILMRRLLWPLPLRFAGRIMIADPAAIRPGAVWQSTEVARLTSTLPVDNFEGMAIVPRQDGRVTVWLISDDNHAVTQRTLLWKLVVDPARLP
jgi:hypothetical protein